MISGFVILLTAASGDLRKFVISRMTRLLAAFWICCTLTFFAILMLGEPMFMATLKQYLVNMTLLAEFLDVPYIDSVYWTLTVELKFYAFIAIILTAGRFRNIEVLMIAWLAATIVLDVFPSWRVISAILSLIALMLVSAYFVQRFIEKKTAGVLKPRKSS